MRQIQQPLKMKNLVLGIKKSNLLSSLIKGSLIVFIIQVLGTGLRYLSQIFFARWMGPREFGEFSIAISVAQLLAVIASLGLNTGVLRFIPEYLVKSDWSRISGLLKSSKNITFMFGFALSIFGLLIIWIIDNNISENSIFFGLLLIPLLSLMNVQMEVLRSFKKMTMAYTPTMIFQYLFVIIITFTFFRFTNDLNSVNVIVFTIMSIVFVLLIQERFLKLTLPKEIFNSSSKFEINKWLKTSYPLLLMSGLMIVLNQADILLVGIFLGPEKAGIYTAATKTAALTSFVLIAVNGIVAPMISDLYTRKENQRLQSIVHIAAIGMFWPTLIIALFLFVFGEFVLISLFGPEFADGRIVLILITIGQLVNASAGPVGYLMGLTGYQVLSARVYFWSALTNIILNLILLPLFGIWGAAIATTIAMVMWNIWLFILVKKYLGIHSFAFKFDK